MAEQGTENFIITIDDSKMQQQKERIVDAIDDIGKAAVESSGDIDKLSKADMGDLVGQVEDVKDELVATSQAAAGTKKDLADAMSAKPGESLKGQLRRMTEEIAILKNEYRSLSQAEQESANGQALLQKIDALTQKAGVMRDAMDDANKSIRNVASDTAKWDAMGQGINVLTSSIGAATGAMEMLGMSQEDAQEIQAKLQASLAISNALTVAQNALQKESALMIGLRTAQEGAAAIAINIRTAAEGKGIVATKAATLAQAAFNAVAKANPYVLLASAVISVVGALALFVQGSKKAKEAEAERAKEAERAAELMKEAQEKLEHNTQALVSGAGALIVQYQLLQKQYAKLSTQADKVKFIKDHTEDFRQLGISVNNVSDAENVFINNTNAIVAAMQARVKAAGTYKLATEAYEKFLKLQHEETQLRDKYLADDITDEKRSQIGTQLAKVIEEQTAAGQEYNGYLQEAIKSQEELQNIVKNTPNLLTGKSGNTKAKGGKSATPKVDDTAKKVAEEEYKQIREANRTRERLILENRQITLDMEKESSDKRIKQIELDYDKQKQAIKEKEEDLVEAKYQAAKRLWEAGNQTDFKKTRDDFKQLTAEESTNLTAMKDANEQNRTRALQEELDNRRQLLNEYLADYGSYTQKLQAIMQLYNDQMEKSGTTEKSKLGAQMLDDLSNVRSQFQDSLADVSSSSLQSIMQGLQYVVYANKEAFSTEQLDAYKMQLDDLASELESRNPFSTLKSAAEELESAEQEVRDAVVALNIAQSQEANAQTPEEEAAAKEKVVQATDNLNAALAKENKARTRLKKAQSDSIAACRKLVDALGDVGDAIGGTTGDIIGIVTTISTTVLSSIEGMKAASAAGATAIAAVEKASVILAIISAAIQVCMKIANLLTAAHDAKYEKQIENYQKQIDSLNDAYKVLGERVENTYSKVKQGNIEAQIANQKKQIELLGKQIDAENAKKKTDKDNIEQYQDKIKECEDNIKDLKKEAQDAIFGEDINSAIENFADAYAEAWANGESRVKSAKEVVKDMMRQMVTESIKSALQTSESLEKIREKIREFYADNVLTAWEQDYIYDMAEQAQKELDEQFGWADRLLGNNSSQQTSSGGGFATASQDSVDELNGRFTAVQMGVNSIDAKMSEVIDINTQMSEHVVQLRLHTEEIASYSRQAVDYLGGIEKNTRELYTMSSKLDQIERNTRAL